MGDARPQILVTLAAARQYAAAKRLGEEEARRELTELMLEARQLDEPNRDGTEAWRYRSRTTGLDIHAHISREGRLAVVVHVRVRSY